MPWLNTPQDRQATFIEPLYPLGGLLGGSGAQPKMSKLKELAAARKKKAEEKKAGENTTENIKTPVIDTTQRLGKLSLGAKAKQKEPTLTSDSTSSAAVSQVPSIPLKRKTSDVVQLDGPPAKSPVKSEDVSPLEPAPPEPAAPSDFAQALLGSAQTAHAPRTYALPYMSFTSSVAEAFSGPSPDDVVLTAQAKGSLSSARKA